MFVWYSFYPFTILGPRPKEVYWTILPDSHSTLCRFVTVRVRISPFVARWWNDFWARGGKSTLLGLGLNESSITKDMNVIFSTEKHCAPILWLLIPILVIFLQPHPVSDHNPTNYKILLWIYHRRQAELTSVHDPSPLLRRHSPPFLWQSRRTEGSQSVNRVKWLFMSE